MTSKSDPERSFWIRHTAYVKAGTAGVGDVVRQEIVGDDLVADFDGDGRLAQIRVALLGRHQAGQVVGQHLLAEHVPELVLRAVRVVPRGAVPPLTHVPSAQVRNKGEMSCSF